MSRGWQKHETFVAPNCGDCGAVMVLSEGRPVRSGPRLKFWACSMFPKCKSSHGAHQSTGAPMGIPADKATRQARVEAHKHFDALWRNGGMSREAAYVWLRTVLFLTRDAAHISMLTKAQCEKVVAAAKKMATPKESQEKDGE